MDKLKMSIMCLRATTKNNKTEIALKNGNLKVFQWTQKKIVK